MDTLIQYNAEYIQVDPAHHSDPAVYQPYPSAREHEFTHTDKPTNWLCPAIFSCMCCVLPLGLKAIFYAEEANRRAERNDLRGAEKSANRARNYTISSIVIGIIAWTALLISLLFLSQSLTA
ncbi:trafficking regulator of GLUT4 1-like [Ostrea edulis]|uniref:trafficking regulator of GLUT4 1-like n=1 Tax=Ostrea edulis TaxID=37623 RepID=UPI0020964004|nr:trafficking regulator of GLUT4 1-like [Ostrea edulis]